jgi:hypothetical protein
MRLTVLTLTALIALPLPAAAQSQLDRMEVLSERANALMNEAMIAQAPQLDGQMPSPEWDDALRAAFGCVLDGYRSDVGDEGVDVMLDQMETTLDGATAEDLMNGTMNERVDLPEGITPERGTELMTSCGVMEIYMTRMMESGVVEAMSQ